MGATKRDAYLVHAAKYVMASGGRIRVEAARTALVDSRAYISSSKASGTVLGEARRRRKALQAGKSGRDRPLRSGRNARSPKFRKSGNVDPLITSNGARSRSSQRLARLARYAASGSSSSSVVGARARTSRGASTGRPRRSRMWRAAPVSTTGSMSRSRPLHFGHSRILTSNVLWRSCGHRWRGEVAYSSPPRRRDQCRTLRMLGARFVTSTDASRP